MFIPMGEVLIVRWVSLNILPLLFVPKTNQILLSRNILHTFAHINLGVYSFDLKL
jgi:hypothetical protein